MKQSMSKTWAPTGFSDVEDDDYGYDDDSNDDAYDIDNDIDFWRRAENWML